MFSDIWKISNKYDDPEGLAKPAGSLDVFKAAAYCRCPEDTFGFTDLGLHRLYDCFLLPDMEKAVDRILEAADTGERIGIFGDYDCDGACATALLYDFLKKQLECSVIWRVPERKEGYGLSEKAVDEFSGLGVTLIITVDNGISAADAVDYADSLGIDVIVTDHHEVTGELPRGLCVVDPQREDSKYPVKNICGCVVAYKLCEAISLSIGIDGIENYLPLAAIATVGDVMELQGENRSIVKLGLEMMRDTMFPGLNLLIAEKTKKKQADMTAEFLSFYVTPMINAAGRMGDAASAVKLLLAESESEALPVFEDLRKLDEIRKTASDKAASEFNADPGRFLLNSVKSPMIFIKGDGWGEGIISSLAGKFCEKFGKNVCVLTEAQDPGNGEKVLRASARGTGTVNLVQTVSACSDLLIACGGHKKASGFTVYEKNIGELMSRLNGILEKVTPAVNTKEALLYLSPESITIDNADRLQKLEPFGEGNSRPVFVTDGIESMETVRFGTPPKVIRFNIRFRGGNFATGVLFKDLEYFDMFLSSAPVAVVYTLGINEYNGTRTVQLNILDFIEGDRDAAGPVTSNYGEQAKSTGEALYKAFHMTKENLLVIYRKLRTVGGSFTFSDLAAIKREAMKQGGEYRSLFTWFKLKYAIEVLVELGLVIKDKTGFYRFPSVQEKKDLSDSKTFDSIGTGCR